MNSSSIPSQTHDLDELYTQTRQHASINAVARAVRFRAYTVLVNDPARIMALESLRKNAKRLLQQRLMENKKMDEIVLLSGMWDGNGRENLEKLNEGKLPTSEMRLSIIEYELDQLHEALSLVLAPVMNLATDAHVGRDDVIKAIARQYSYEDNSTLNGRAHAMGIDRRDCDLSITYILSTYRVDG